MLSMRILHFSKVDEEFLMDELNHSLHIDRQYSELFDMPMIHLY